MRIGIVTKIGKNYGALLQAYALNRACNELGHDSHIIKYTPAESQKTYKVIKYPWGPKGTIVNLKSILHFSECKSSSNKFLKFRDKYFGFLGNYHMYSELEKNCPQCDLFIAGSDQVWNPEISFDKAFYLTFAVNKDARLTSYAASIGLKNLPEEIKEEFKARVMQFDYISVREKQAQYILDGLEIKSDVAPDPTLLFDKESWNSIAIDTIKEPYILCYFVSFPKGIEATIQNIKERIDSSIKIVNLMTSEDSASVGDILIRDAGPEEFLGLFKNASYIITSSFHGTVFSIINRKPFSTTLYSSTSSRVTELLDSVGLSDRIISVNEGVGDDYNMSVLYSEDIEDKIKCLRNEGYSVLNKLLSIGK